MPSSADEALVQEELGTQRKDSLGQTTTSKKQKKKAKKAASAIARLAGESEDQNSEKEGSTPPVELL